MTDERQRDHRFSHDGCDYLISAHLLYDLRSTRIAGWIAATATQVAPNALEMVNALGSPLLFVSADTLDQGIAVIEKAIRSGELATGLSGASQPDSPGDGA